MRTVKQDLDYAKVQLERYQSIASFCQSTKADARAALWRERVADLEEQAATQERKQKTQQKHERSSDV